MEQHPFPRQITTFEFKLIGFMTIKQFGFVLLGGVFAYAAFLIVPIYIVNMILGVLVFCVFLAFAFIPINDRPLDVFAKNLYTRITSPTQYLYHKNDKPMDIMSDMYFESNPHITIAHADSREKLAKYMANKITIKKEDAERLKAISRINAAISTKGADPTPQSVRTIELIVPTDASTQKSHIDVATEIASPAVQLPKETPAVRHPFFSGTVTNTRNIPLPGVLVYIKDPTTMKSLRILKTNPHGVFATFNALPQNKYHIEVVDSSSNYRFEPTDMVLGDNDRHTSTFVSKELI